MGQAIALGKDFQAARTKVVDALKTEGFGVLTEIDVQKTFKEKIDKDFRRYTILGACNPTLAHEALQIDLDVGMMIPCNVLLYEDDAGVTHVKPVDPTRAAESIDNPGLTDFAADVKTKITRALAALK